MSPGHLLSHLKYCTRRELLVDIRQYWEQRFSGRFDIGSSGHISFNYRYNSYVYRAYVRALRKALREFNIQVAGNRILDLGSGTGFWIDFYSHMHPKAITGIDITKKSVNELQRRYPQYDFKRLDIGATGFEASEPYDLLNTFDVLYYIIEEGNFERAIKNISKAASPGAYILITDTLVDFLPRKEPVYSKHRAYERYVEVLGRNGVDILKVIPVNYLLKKPLPFAPLYSFAKWQLSKIGFDLEGTIGHILYVVDGLVASTRRSDIKLMVCRRTIDV